MLANTAIGIHVPTAADLVDIQHFLEGEIVNPETGIVITEELIETVAEIEDFVAGKTKRKYFVAKDADGNIIGLIGADTPTEEMKRFARTGVPLEVLNTFLAEDARSNAIGAQIIDFLEAFAAELGFTELIANGEPRTMQRSTMKPTWSIWEFLFGPPTTAAPELSAVGRGSSIWSQPLGGISKERQLHRDRSLGR